MGKINVTQTPTTTQTEKNFRYYDLNQYYLPKFCNSYKRRYQQALNNKQRVRLLLRFSEENFEQILRHYFVPSTKGLNSL